MRSRNLGAKRWYVSLNRIRFANHREPKMSSTLKVEILSICAAFAFVTAVLAIVW